MNIYSSVTDRVLRSLESGVIPWRKTWRTGLPRNLLTGREYRGINILVLGLTEFSSCYWLTYRQALQMGGHVRRGERATAIVYWKWRNEEELARVAEQTGKAQPSPCYPFVSAVFNLDQVEDIPRPTDDLAIQDNQRFEAADQLILGMPNKPEIVHGACRSPAY